MRYLYLLLFIIFLCTVHVASGQLYCPTNINFELGSLTGWNFYIATNNGASGISTLTSTTPLSNRHVLTSGTSTDFYGGFPIVDPNGGNYSLKLGNDGIGAQVDQARYTFTVPSTINNYSLIYRYAVVFENPGHTLAEQPYFQVRVYNAATNAIINCGSFTYVSQSSLPGFLTSSFVGQHPGGSIVYYRPWSTASLNLTGQAGNTLVVEFTTADCSQLGHMGYGYVDVSCGLFAISSSTCNATSPLSAPPGFQKYTWYNANYTTVVDTGRLITVPTPATLTQLHVVLTPFPGFGCPDTLTTQIIGSSLAVNAGPDTMLCNNPGIVLSPIVTGNAAPYSYSWTPATGLSCTTCGSPTATPAAHTSYVVSVTDSFGCTKKDTVLVRAPVSVTATTVPALCYTSATGSALAVASLGTGPYTYSWNTTPAQMGANATSLSAGAYTVTATDTKGCTDTQRIAVTSPPALNAGIASTDSVSCNGGSDGRATAIVAGGISPYTYSWNTTPIQTGRVATGLPGGIRIATVTDSNGCTDTAIAMVPQPSPLVPFVTRTAVLCKGGSTGTATVSVAGGAAPYTYAIDAGSFGSTITFNGLNAGPHIIHLKDAKGCIKDTSILITEPAKLAIAYTSIQPLCNGGSNGAITITAAGGIPAYRYALGTGSFGSGTVFSGLSAGAYVLHILDSNGCTADSLITLMQPTVLNATTTVSNALCHGDSSGSVTVTAAGGTSPYTYAIGTGAFGASNAFTRLAAGAYSIQIKDTNGCTKTSSITITEPSVLSLGYTSIQPSCSGAPNGSLNITGSGGTTPYQYALNALAFVSSGSFSGLMAGTYTLHIRDANSCTKDSIITLTQPTTISATTTKTNVSCFGGSNGTAQVAATGGSTPYTYAWSGTTQTSSSVTGLAAGLYTVTITDSKGCTGTATVAISQPTAITASFSSTAPICSNTATGSATVTASGGTPPYSYSWLTTPVRTTATANLLNTGSYSVTITDAAGCTLTAGTTVPQTLPVTVSTSTTPASCFGKMDGVATAIPSGSSAPYTYSWNTVPVQTGATATALAAGSYIVTATSAAGCVGAGAVTVSQPADLLTSILARGTCPGLSQGSMLATVSGGNIPYTYFWNTTPVRTTATISGLDTGTYTLIISDSKGCRDTAFATISEYDNPEVKAGPAQEICRGSGTELSANGAVNYSWAPGASLSCTACATPVASPATNTIYTVTGIDEHGCSDTDTVSIFVMQHVPVSVGEKIVICKGDSARLNAYGGIAWQWFPAATIIHQDSTTALVRPQATTVYKVAIRENRCFTDTLGQEVEVLPTPAVNLGPDLEAPMGATLQLNAVVTGATKITWTPADGLSCSDCFTPQTVVRGKATYIVEVQNYLGCAATDTLNIRDICDEHYFYFANTFTPNGDGQNDRFYPQGTGSSLVAHFMIYDRWGEIVFSANNIYVNDPSAGWDGTFRNQALKPDVYVYVMEAVCETGHKVVVRGDISLIR